VILQYTPFLVIGLLLLLLLGTVVGRRIGNRSILWLCGIMLISTVILVTNGARQILSGGIGSGAGFLSAMLMFVPLYFGLGVFIGRMHRRTRSTFEDVLVFWKQQLAKDEAAGASPLVIAEDLRTIGQICEIRLGNRAEALAAYDRAYAIFESQIPGHPSLCAFYRSYAGALRSAKRQSDAAAVDARLKSLPEDLTRLSIVPTR
jgi:hypothetical protein